MEAKGIETEREVDGRWIAEDKSRPGMMAYGATKIEAVLAVDNMRIRVENEALKEENAELSAVVMDAAEPSLALAEITRQRDEAVKHYHAAIELADVQKYATLLDERDALAVRLEAAEKENKRLEGKVVACQNRIDDDTESMNKLCARVGAPERQNAAMREALEAIHKCWIVTAGNPALKYALELVSGALTIAPVPESQYAESIADPKLAAWYQQIANFANHMAWLTDQSEAAEKSGIDGRDVQVNISAQFYAVRTGTEWHMRFTLADLRRALSVFNRE